MEETAWIMSSSLNLFLTKRSTPFLLPCPSFLYSFVFYYNYLCGISVANSHKTQLFLDLFYLGLTVTNGEYRKQNHKFANHFLFIFIALFSFLNFNFFTRVVLRPTVFLLCALLSGWGFEVVWSKWIHFKCTADQNS